MNTIIRKLLLASSIALALGTLGGTAFAADAKAQETTKEQAVDARREARILTSFEMNRHLRAYDLTVKVDGGNAVLDGKVDDAVAKELAEQIALGADGITKVDNRIVVDANYSRPARTANERSFNEKVSDATITASVKSKLLWNSHTDGLDIHVDTKNGKVTLTGTAATGAEKDLAGRIARDTSGVMALNNEIALSGKPDTKAKVKQAGEKAEVKVSDSWITTKVKFSLINTRSVEAFDITVTTINGVVTLNGIVDNAAQRDLAIQVAQDVRGVKKVDASGLKVG